MWRHWSSQPGKLAGFGLFFVARNERAISRFRLPPRGWSKRWPLGPTRSGQRAAAWGYGLFACWRSCFYFARNIGVRFWIPFAANNMEHRHRRLPRRAALLRRLARRQFRRRDRAARVARDERLRHDLRHVVWFMLPAVGVLTGVTVLTRCNGR